MLSAVFRTIDHKEISIDSFRQIHKEAKVETADGKVTISTPPYRYAYAVNIDLTALGQQGGAQIEVVARTKSGIVSFGVPDLSDSIFLVERQLYKRDDFSTIRLKIQFLSKVKQLVVRSFSQDGEVSIVEIQDLKIYKTPSVNFSQLYAVGGVIRLPTPRLISLSVRKLLFESEEVPASAERCPCYVNENRRIDVSSMAFYLVDPWAKYPDHCFEKRAKEHVATKIVPLLKVVRKHKIMTIIMPHAHVISPEVAPQDGEVIIFGGENYPVYQETYGQELVDLLDFLKEKKVTTIVFAGYALNRCLLHRPAGLLAMAQRGFQCIILRDCTLADELQSTLENEYIKLSIISMIEDQYGGSITTGDFEAALEA